MKTFLSIIFVSVAFFASAQTEHVFNLSARGIISGNGSSITNLNGTNIISGTINSNAMDAATLAAFTAAGGGGATIATTGNLISGDGAGNGVDSGISPTNILLRSESITLGPIATNAPAIIGVDAGTNIHAITFGSGLTLTTNSQNWTLTATGGGSSQQFTIIGGQFESSSVGAVTQPANFRPFGSGTRPSAFNLNQSTFNRDLLLTNLSIAYSSTITTVTNMYWKVMTNAPGSYTPMYSGISLTTGGVTNGAANYLHNTTGSCLLPAGWSFSLQITNENATTTIIYGGWSVEGVFTP